jgi:hypothetical protein
MRNDDLVNDDLGIFPKSMLIINLEECKEKKLNKKFIKKDAI